VSEDGSLPELAAAVRRYAERLDAAVPDGQYVASPLGALLVLALLAPAARGEARVRLESVLGLDADSAGRAVAALLAEPHAAAVARSARRQRVDRHAGGGRLTWRRARYITARSGADHGPVTPVTGRCGSGHGRVPGDPPGAGDL
jgi:hypothetical protein